MIVYPAVPLNLNWSLAYFCLSECSVEFCIHFCSLGLKTAVLIMAQGPSDMETADQEESSPNMIVYRKVRNLDLTSELDC